MTKTIILELTYDSEVSADTLAALLDSHSQDEGLVGLKGRMVTGELEMPVGPDTNNETECNCGFRTNQKMLWHDETCPLYPPELTKGQ